MYGSHQDFFEKNNIDFDLGDYARGVGYKGTLADCQKIIDIDEKLTSALIHGAASAGKFALANQLAGMVEYKYNILNIARGCSLWRLH